MTGFLIALLGVAFAGEEDKKSTIDFPQVQLTVGGTTRGTDSAVKLEGGLLCHNGERLGGCSRPYVVDADDVAPARVALHNVSLSAEAPMTRSSNSFSGDHDGIADNWQVGLSYRMRLIPNADSESWSFRLRASAKFGVQGFSYQPVGASEPEDAIVPRMSGSLAARYRRGRDSRWAFGVSTTYSLKQKAADQVAVLQDAAGTAEVRQVEGPSPAGETQLRADLLFWPKGWHVYLGPAVTMSWEPEDDTPFGGTPVVRPEAWFLWAPALTEATNTILGAAATYSWDEDSPGPGLLVKVAFGGELLSL